MARAVDPGRLVQVPGDGVEESVDQEGVHAQRSAEVHEDQRQLAVEPQHRDHLAQPQDQDEDRHEGQHLREHLQHQQRGQPRSPPGEAEAGEGIGRGRAHEHRPDGGHQPDHQRVDHPGPEVRVPQSCVVAEGDGAEELVGPCEGSALGQGGGDDVDDRKDRDGRGDHRHQMAPAQLREPACDAAAVRSPVSRQCVLRHQLISSRDRVRRKLITAMTVTIRKITSDIAAARP